VGADRVNRFSYSLDEGRSFIAWPDPYPLRSGGHRGDRVGLYTYNNRAVESGRGPGDANPDASWPFGYADFDYLRLEISA
jgi:hypothetical protein